MVMRFCLDLSSGVLACECIPHASKKIKMRAAFYLSIFPGHRSTSSDSRKSIEVYLATVVHKLVFY
jgi:hypothetical protein